jgi:selenocysteine lyase/cysteine desulfurase
VIRRELGMSLPNQGHWFNADRLYERFTPAGPDHAQVAACAGMADYYDAVYAHHFKGHVGPSERRAAVHDLLRAHERELLQPLLDNLTERNSVRLIGSTQAEKRAPTVAVELEAPGAEIAAALAPYGIMAGGGDFYGSRPLSAMGIDLDKGVLRLSFVHYTKKEDIDHLVGALNRVL